MALFVSFIICRNSYIKISVKKFKKIKLEKCKLNFITDILVVFLPIKLRFFLLLPYLANWLQNDIDTICIIIFKQYFT